MDVGKAVFIRKFRVLKFYIRKNISNQQSKFLPQENRKRRENKQKARRKGMIKIRTRISTIENMKTKEKIKAKTLGFLKI